MIWMINDRTSPQNSPKNDPITFGMGNFCQGTFQSRIITKEEINAPRMDPKVDKTRVKDKGDRFEISKKSRL